VSAPGRSPECVVVRAGEPRTPGQGLRYERAISAERVGATGLCMHQVTIGPSERARAHRHDAHESAIYVIEGEVEMWWGERLEHHLAVGPGDFLYIPAGVPHLPANRSATRPARGIIARTDAAEQEQATLLPELDALLPPA
jgi:uncharacterized RmlC-like cupin family protein